MGDSAALSISPSDKALALVAAYYATSLPVKTDDSLAQAMSSLTLSTGSTIVGSNTIATYLASTSAQGEKEAGSTDIEKAEVAQWLTLSAKFAEDKSSLETLNSHLETRTYITSPISPALADLIVYARLQPIYAADKSLHHTLINLTRWFDFVQNNESVRAAIEKASIDLPVVEIDLSAPKQERKKVEKKDKKKEKDAAKADPKKEKTKDIAAAATESAVAAPTTTPPLKDKKKDKKDKPKKEKAPPPPPTPLFPDLRVGYIEKAVKHPDADALYVSTIHCGDEAPRTVVSGLVRYVPLEAMQGRKVIVITSLKPAKMRGILSEAMVLCAVREEGENRNVEPIAPPADAETGAKLWVPDFEGFVEKNGNKVWERFAPDLKTDAEGKMVWQGKTIRIGGAEGGECGVTVDWGKDCTVG
ncbi:nucleic acid-binding protein [Saitoella complicata NRRL Y-17804]|nr:nucleic acid-binding protein [Saitoella complicata NRRL Y-17804]ODQ54011.1 nucleic acid-binding protein [Saitoella complicata NRRL Y-17804]